MSWRNRNKDEGKEAQINKYISREKHKRKEARYSR